MTEVVAQDDTVTFEYNHASVVLGGVVEVVGSNLARGKIFTASIGSVDSLYPSVYIYIYIYTLYRII